MFKGWTTLIDTSKLAGWIRAGVASGIGIALVRWPVLTDWLPADAQQAISIAVATTVVGLWSHAAKKIDG